VKSDGVNNAERRRCKVKSNTLATGTGREQTENLRVEGKVLFDLVVGGHAGAGERGLRSAITFQPEIEERFFASGSE
jgi:hypothetical protein